MRFVGKYGGPVLVLSGLLATYAAWVGSYAWSSAWLIHHHHLRLLSIWLGPGLGVCLLLALLLGLPLEVLGVLLWRYGRDQAPADHAKQPAAVSQLSRAALPQRGRERTP